METLKSRDRGGDKSSDRKQGLILIEQNREKNGIERKIVFSFKPILDIR